MVSMDEGRDMPWRKAAIRFEVVLLAASFVLVFLPTFSWLWRRWTASGTFYSHGAIIPPLAVFLAWYRISKGPPARAPSEGGIIIVVLGLLLHLVSLSSDIHFLSGLGMIVVLAGICLYLYGMPLTRRVGPAFVLLLFMVPVPRVLLIDTAFRMQLASTSATASLLRAVGLPIGHEGVYITSGGARLFEVAYPCSGLRSLLVFICLSWVIISMAPSVKLVRSAMFLALSLPLAFSGNIARLSLTAVAALQFGRVEFVHTAASIVAFALYAFLMVVIGKRLLWKED